MRLIKIPIQNLDELALVRARLKDLGWMTIEFQFIHMPNFGVYVLRNKQAIVGNLEMATHDVDEDLTVTPGRFLKLSEDAVNAILDTKNFIDN